MKDLLTYIIDCGGAGCATLANTTGAGNPAPPMDSDGEPTGSGDVPNAKTAKAKVEKPKKKKRKKKGEEE